MPSPQKLTAIGLVLGFVIATAAFAHQGVKDPQVKARMHVMGDISAATKTLGAMARGKAPFDAQAAQEAKAILIETAAQIPEYFAEPAQDPVSESRPEIWTNFDDFTAKSQTMFDAVDALDVSDLASLQSGFGAMGASCSGCHKAYRAKK